MLHCIKEGRKDDVSKDTCTNDDDAVVVVLSGNNIFSSSDEKKEKAGKVIKNTMKST